VMTKAAASTLPRSRRAPPVCCWPSPAYRTRSPSVAVPPAHHLSFMDHPRKQYEVLIICRYLLIIRFSLFTI
jgi:hypothetical protein